MRPAQGEPNPSKSWYSYLQPPVTIAFFALVVAVATFGLNWQSNFVAKRDETARTLLNEGLAVHALMEAWLLEGPNYETLALSKAPALTSRQSDFGPWLRQVEVRAVLDQAPWSAPTNRFYDFIDGRRAWIVRDSVPKTGCPSFETRSIGNYLTVKPHAALLSSRALQELRGWVERVASAYDANLLSSAGLDSLRPLIVSVAGQDRLAVFPAHFSERAKAFLRNNREHPHC